MIELSDISHVGSEAIMNEQEGLNVRSDVEGAAEADGGDGVRRRPTMSRKLRLRSSHRRLRHRATSSRAGEPQQNRRSEETQLAQDIIQDIVAQRSNIGSGKALLGGGQGLNTIRESGLSLKEKRNILVAVKEEELTRRKRRDRGVGCCTMFNAAVAMKMQHLRYRILNLIYGINFWQNSIKAVEGLFGTGVGSYFRFLKWLFLLNIPIFLICFSFVTIPQLVSDLSEYPNKDCPRKNFIGWELLTGKGNFSCSPLYYGHYTNETISVVTGCYYSMPLFYILSIGLYFLINLVVIAVRISSSYRVNFIEGSGDFKFYFVNKVFAGWDFGVSDPDAAALKQKSLRQEIGEYISLIHARAKTRKKDRGFALLLLRHLIIHSVVILLLVGCGYVMYLLLDEEATQLGDIKDEKIIGDLISPIVITGMIFFVPKIFSLLTLVEKYELPQTSLYMTLVRTVGLYTVVLGGLLWFWTKTLQGSSKVPHCWENRMGQDIYELVIMDFIMTLLDSFFTDFLRSVMVKVLMIVILKRERENVQALLPNFNVALNTMNLIYSQSLAWFGIFYSPLLPVVQLIKLFLVFYLKKITVLKFCAPFKQAWRGARIQTMFLILLFLGFMTATVLLACGFYLATPSAACGPYRGKEKVHQALLEFVAGLAADDKGLYTIIDFLTSSWFIMAVIVFLSIKVYYARVSAIARLETITMLKRQLQLSSFDKKFLLKQIQENSRGRYSKGEYAVDEINNPYGCSRGSTEPETNPTQRGRQDDRHRSSLVAPENQTDIEMHHL